MVRHLTLYTLIRKSPNHGRPESLPVTLHPIYLRTLRDEIKRCYSLSLYPIRLANYVCIFIWLAYQVHLL